VPMAANVNLTSRDFRSARNRDGCKCVARLCDATGSGLVMPRYFFNVYHDQTQLDFEGEELPDMQAAWKEATVTAGQMIQGIDGRLRPGAEWRLEVTDEFANPLYVIYVHAERRT